MSCSIHPPVHAQIVVIGGGPGGSYAACALAREGFDVVLLEAASFPRYHIGESLLPSIRHHLKFIDAEEKVKAYGFAHKPGAAIKFNQYEREGYTDFVALGHDNSSWNVVRSEFDALLLEHARSNGVKVFQCTRVLSVEFQKSNPLDIPGRPTSANWSHCPPSSSPCASDSPCNGTITFDYLVDASGRAGILSTKYMKNRRFNSNLKNVAIWGYWDNVGIYGEGTTAEGAPYFEALKDQSGWAWFIPLNNKTTSVGIVTDQKVFSRSHSKSFSTTSLGPSLVPDSQTPFFSSPLSQTTSSSPDISRTFSPGRFSIATPPTSPSLSNLLTPKSNSFRSSINLASSTAANLANKYLSLLELAPKVVELIGPDGSLVQCKKTPCSTPPPGITSPRSPRACASAGDLGTPFSEPSSVSGTPPPPRRPFAGRVDTFGTGVPYAGGGPMSPGPGNAFGSAPEFNIESSANAADSPIRMASDYSYSATTYAGDRFRIVGDAGAFIDPFFSSGVHLAMTGGLAAATSIAASIRGECPEQEAAEWHTHRVSISYTRFLLVVLSVYKQIRAEPFDVLSDVTEENFDKAFDFIRPVIQGNADLGPRLSESEVQSALDFCVNFFNPVSQAETEAVRKRFEGVNLNRELKPDLPPTPTSPSKPKPHRYNTDEPVPKDQRTHPGIPELPDADTFGAVGAQGPPTRPAVVGRKRSKTIDTVIKWLGKVSGMKDVDEEGSESPEGTSTSPKNTPETPSHKSPVPKPSTNALFDVTAPLIPAAQIDEIARFAHATTPSQPPTLSLRSPGPRKSTPGLLPALDISRANAFGSSATSSSGLPSPSPTTLAPSPVLSTMDDSEAIAETKRVLAKINARRVLHKEHGGLHCFEEEVLGGWSARLERGRLGLVKVKNSELEPAEGSQKTKEEGDRGIESNSGA